MLTDCTLCPRDCHANRQGGETGFCLCKDSVTVARAAPHYWEEPCISGTKGSGTVFFSGCNLGCIFCQNKELCTDGIGKEISIERLSDIFISLQSRGVHNINLVTPTPWSEHIKAALDIAWSKGLWLPTVYNCGGYEKADTIKGMSGYIRVYLPDFKYIGSDIARRLSLASDYPKVAKAAIEEMVRQCPEPIFDSDGIMTRGVIVRHLVLPSELDNSKRVLEYLYKTYGDSIYISIMSQYTPMPNMSGELARTLTSEEYTEIVEYADKLGIKNGFIQEGDAAKESFIPLWDCEGVP